MEVFPNMLPERLASELQLAQKLGVTPVLVGEAGFDKAINEGDGQIKWVVTIDGKLRIIPKFVDNQEIAHSVIANGNDVIAAGEAYIAGAGGEYIELEITNYSGHYAPSKASLSIGRANFESYGIIFP